MSVPWARPGERKREDMTVKQYLNQVRRVDLLINQRIDQLQELREIAAGLRSPNMQQDAVQTSPEGDPIGRAVSRYMDKEREIDELIDKFVDLKDQIIGEIQALPDPRHVEVLHLRYIKYMTMKDIAKKMHYEYKYACKIHGDALAAFGRTRTKTN